VTSCPSCLRGYAFFQRSNGIDMWIVAERDGAYDPNAELLGGGYSNGIGY
jgi:hypothetical protein